VLEQWLKDLVVRMCDIVHHAISIWPNFRRGSKKKVDWWVYSFIGRSGLLIWRITQVGQKLTGHLEEVCQDIAAAIILHFLPGRTLHGIERKYFINMDQTSAHYELKSSTTVSEVGLASVPARDSGSNSKWCTVVLAVAADGSKLPPFVIFKGTILQLQMLSLKTNDLHYVLLPAGTPGKHVENEIKRKGWKGCVQQKGWFDGRVAQIWIETILKPYLVGSSGLYLLIDHYMVHLTGDFVKACNDLGTEVNSIPAGYTCVLQPLDVGVNGPFKAHLCNLSQNWSTDKYIMLAHGDRFPTPSWDEIYPWISLAFAAICPELYELLSTLVMPQEMALTNHSWMGRMALMIVEVE